MNRICLSTNGLLHSLAILLVTACMVALLPSPRASADTVVVENFDAYPVQSDTTGFGAGPIFRATTTGTYGSSGDFYVFNFLGPYAQGVHIVDAGGGDRQVSLTTSSATGLAANDLVTLGTMRFPGYGDTSPAGPFANFFATPQDLTLAYGSIDAMVVAEPEPTFMVGIGEDINGNRIATDPIPLTSSGMFTYHGTSADFINLLQAAAVDPTQMVAFEIALLGSTDSNGELAAYDFRFDNLNMTVVPEPASAAGLLGLTLIGATFYRRRRTSG